ncbi:hypothetical protein GCM10010377_70320 [Streptomyces viridiviolaceus]|uniref:hypothetical protein n=1 Tax=Streptomyces viridiviolaceus TaxID=68282 RepID=UPI00167AC430|nr:hypothetical protein [Streptomyces viridiviolaceus]GHB69558.1 hypothetical protein GCM10010377_70320 [Streptomyces viridiviolaceus]
MRTGTLIVRIGYAGAPSDMTDAEWAAVRAQPVAPKRAKKVRKKNYSSRAATRVDESESAP